MDENAVPLSLLRRELARAAGVSIECVPDYRRLYLETLNGRIPAEQQRGRWYVRKDDLPAIASALGVSAAA